MAAIEPHKLRMAQNQRTDASLAPRTEPAPSVSASTQQFTNRLSLRPPTEDRKSLWLRRYAVLSFWAVAICLGLPIWLKTTAIYRAELPLQEMTDWAKGKVCEPELPLRIGVETALHASDAQAVLSVAQHSLDQLNEFPAHQLRLLLADHPQVANASQQVIGHGMSISSSDKDVALLVRLIPMETGDTPRSHLQPYTSTLDIYFSTQQIHSQTSIDSPLGTFLAQELQTIFVEEQVRLAYTFATIANKQIPSSKSLTLELWAELQRQTTRSLKYAPTYHLTFSLFTPTYTPSAWDIEGALRSYLNPLLDSLSSISNFTVDTQVQLYATFSPNIKQPEHDEHLNAWTIRKEDLSGFVNAAEWSLTPSIGDGPTVNFILYVPDKAQSPLLIKGSEASSWLVPQWGGVHILNLAGDQAPSTLSAEILAPAMHTFSTQLTALFGLSEKPESLPLRISFLERLRAITLIYSASSTLGALAQVYQRLPSIPVPDAVAQSAHKTIAHLQQGCEYLRDGRFSQALEHARAAEVVAEKAFFERSMVGQVYFPDEHKIAVYLPLLGPIAVPLVMAAVKELQALFGRT